MLKPGYAPMEQYSTHGEQGSWTDVYAMSATIYKLITGKTPPPSTDRILDDTIELPSSLGVNITPEQEAALMRGLALRAPDRTQTMAELAKELRDGLVIPDKKAEEKGEPKKTNHILSIAISAVIAVIAIFLVVTKIIVLNGDYKAAVKLMENGKYAEAYEAFIALGDYKDSADKAESNYTQYCLEKMKIAEVGDTVIFGTYEQDNDTSNGKEDIEWQVLAKENNKLLVISKYGLDCQPYNTSYEDVTWETCTLRTWLNKTFLNDAFSETEQAAIAQTTVTADNNPRFDTAPGSETTAKVFLLSIDEAEKYFSSDDARQCAPTDFAVAKGAWENYTGNCWWWLRSPGYSQDNAADVNNLGSVYCNGDGVSHDCGAVRPALWINLESI
jgi:serine/threonine protein kinase